MEFIRCFGCMEQARTYPCKRCGYDPSLDLPEPFQLRPGVILNGKYVVGKVLGQGGFGITYIGWNLAQDTKVAIKEYFPAGQVMRDSTSKNHIHWFTTSQAKWARADGLDKFLKEALKMSKVRNIPEVVRVQDMFQENGTAYIVMDFVEGRTLKDRLEASGVLTWNKAKDIFIPAIRSMEKVHQYGIIHRDISPDNIMIQPDGKVKILDLGAAKDLSINSGASSMQVAKPGFSPLEQYQVGESGTWTDVYAMAATIYYALTGVVPPAAMDRLNKVDPMRWNHPGFQALPKNVQKALTSALAVNARNRTQNMGDFLAQLQGSGKKADTSGEKKNPDKNKPDPGKKTGQNTGNGGSDKKKNNRVTILAVCVMVLLILVLNVIGLNKNEFGKHTHSWKDATCEEPKTCSSCGMSQGTALGHSWKSGTCGEERVCSRCGKSDGTTNSHKWQDATCEEPKTCSVCGETQGSALGHKWLDATYDDPKTCSRCGETVGDPLGYMETVDGDFSIFSWNGCNTHKYVFSQPVKGCTDFCLYYEPTFNDNCFVGQWQVLIQDTSGNWHTEYTFTLDETYYLHYISLSPKLNIQAVAVIPKASGNYSWSSAMAIYDLHYRN